MGKNAHVLACVAFSLLFSTLLARETSLFGTDTTFRVADSFFPSLNSYASIRAPASKVPNNFKNRKSCKPKRYYRNYCCWKCISWAPTGCALWIWDCNCIKSYRRRCPTGLRKTVPRNEQCRISRFYCCWRCVRYRDGKCVESQYRCNCVEKKLGVCAKFNGKGAEKSSGKAISGTPGKPCQMRRRYCCRRCVGGWVNGKCRRWKWSCNCLKTFRAQRCPRADGLKFFPRGFRKKDGRQSSLRGERCRSRRNYCCRVCVRWNLQGACIKHAYKCNCIKVDWAACTAPVDKVRL